MNQYGLMLLIVVVLFAGQIIGPFVGSLVNLLIGVPVLHRLACAAGGRRRSSGPGRTLAPGCRRRSATSWRTWLTPAQLALFDRMQVADRRHGLDVVAALRKGGASDPDLLVAGVAARLRQGAARPPRAPRGLVARATLRGSGSGGRRATCPRSDTGWTGCALMPIARPSSPRAAGCSPRTVELIRLQENPVDEAGRLLHAADEAN